MPGPGPYRPRPINPTDTALTTGLPSNPNGTYIANTYPQGSAVFGNQGGYGAGLPQRVTYSQYDNPIGPQRPQLPRRGRVSACSGAGWCSSHYLT